MPSPILNTVFDAFYCEPGLKGAHEKGGIEGEVGRFRRNFLTPRVDRSSLVTVRSTKYSVPVRFINRKLRVSLQATQVRIFDGRTLIAVHPRAVARGGPCVQLDHYLEVLKTKPGALPGSTALGQARESGAFTSAHDAFWAAARKTDGDAEAARELIDVLLLHRVMDVGDARVRGMGSGVDCSMKRDMRSRRYTTHWDELPVVRAPLWDQSSLSVHELGLCLDEIPLGFSQDALRGVRMRAPGFCDSLHNKEGKFLSPEVFPEPFLAFQVQIKPPHVNLHVPPPLYDSTLCALHLGHKG